MRLENVEKQRRITIMLDEDEARWLLVFIQNFAGEPGQEPRDAQARRQTLFDLLQDALTQ